MSIGPMNCKCDLEKKKHLQACFFFLRIVKSDVTILQQVGFAGLSIKNQMATLKLKF